MTPLITTLRPRLTSADVRITNWLSKYGLTILRVSLGIMFIWFGVIKFVPGLSPADGLATRTISTLTFGIVQPEVSRPILALWETAIGVGLVLGLWMRATLMLLFMQMMGTITPIVLFPSETWNSFPISPTLEGQYIMKNIVLISVGMVLGATVRGGALVADPEAAKEAVKQQEANSRLKRLSQTAKRVTAEIVASVRK